MNGQTLGIILMVQNNFALTINYSLFFVYRRNFGFFDIEGILDFIIIYTNISNCLWRLKSHLRVSVNEIVSWTILGEDWKQWLVGDSTRVNVALKNDHAVVSWEAALWYCVPQMGSFWKETLFMIVSSNFRYT